MSDLAISESVHEAAADAFCTILERMEDISDADYPKYSGLESNILTILHQLEPSYHLFVGHEYTEKAMDLCRYVLTLKVKLCFLIEVMTISQGVY